MKHNLFYEEESNEITKMDIMSYSYHDYALNKIQIPVEIVSQVISLITSTKFPW